MDGWAALLIPRDWRDVGYMIATLVGLGLGIAGWIDSRRLVNRPAPPPPEYRAPEDQTDDR